MSGEANLLHRFLLVRDCFYDNPSAVLRRARSWEYFEPDDITGYRTTRIYHPPGIRRQLEEVLGLRITRWDDDPEDGNGVFYLSPAAGVNREVPAVHYDEPETDVTVLIYLTRVAPCDCGTSLWRHRSTGLETAPTMKDARRLGVTLERLRDMLEKDAERPTKWVEIDRLGYKFNRLVAYPSGVLHSATRHFGTSIRNARIYQAFRLGVDWSSFRGDRDPRAQTTLKWCRSRRGPCARDAKRVGEFV